MASLLSTLQRRNAELHPRLVEIRRDLHAHPELAFEEVRTAGVVAQWLREHGITPTEGVARTGVVAVIEGNGPGPTLALRADMDALPIREENDVPYCSRFPGKMHACGHDVHTSSLMGTAVMLNELRGEFAGKVKLIFQPSEERLPGGASVMVKEGVLRNPDVQHIVGQHVMPILETGKVGIRSGKYMASADEIYITIHGKGGHGAQPHTTVDPVVIMAQMITALQTVVSRTADPRIPSVLSFGDIHANGATNIIPERVVMQGTFRTFDEAWRMRAHEQIRRVATGVVEAMGGRLDIEIRIGYPVLTNDPALSTRMHTALGQYMGPENVVELDLWPASEDFAYYTQEIPGCFYRLGTANAARGITHGLHTPRFDIDERALGHGPGLMAWLALSELGAA